MACPLQAENIWVQKNLYSEAEKNYFVHLSKLLNGPGAKQPKSNQVKPEKVVGSNETPKQKAAVASDASSQNVATSLPTDTKKEKEKKNKRINKNKDAVAGRTASNESNADVKQNVQFRKAAPSPPKVSTESKDFKSESPNNAQTAAPVAVKKPKKDRWRNRRNKNNNSKEEEHMREGSNQTLNAQDEKKVGSGANQGTLVSEIAKARQHIKNSLERMDGIAALAAASPGGDVLQRLATLENENKNLVELTNLLKKTLGETQNRVQVLEDRLKTLTISGAPAAAKQNGVAAAPAPKPEAKDDDDDVDLFGSDSEGEDAEAAKVREQRLAEYAAKKSKKPVLIAKSSVVLDIKPWDDETDLNKMEEVVRKITTDGLLWGASKFVPVAFGIKKLSISCVVEDDKVSIDWLTEQIEQNEDYVQSVDVAAFNKI